MNWGLFLVLQKGSLRPPDQVLLRRHCNLRKKQGLISMFHCYPVFPVVKEAKEGWDQICIGSAVKAFLYTHRDRTQTFYREEL